MSERYVIERGSGSDYENVAYRERDWEVLDMARHATKRLMCRANREDALTIAAALNSADERSNSKAAA